MAGLSEDELLARRLQEEEDRTLAQESQSNNRVAGMSHLSPQEREDMELARQMQEMDSFGKHGGGVWVDPPGSSSLDPTGLYAGAASYSPPRSNNNSGGGEREDRLAYARRLQEQAFQRMQATPADPQKTTEESDLELAMKMQIEEGGGVDPNALVDQEDEDLKLARFMEESGVSIRELDEQGLAEARGGSASSPPLRAGATGASASSLGLGHSAPNRGNPGMLGGPHDSKRDDSDHDSLELGLEGANQKMPTDVPSSIPPPARSNGIPSGIPSQFLPPAAGTPHSSTPPIAAMPAHSGIQAMPAHSGIPPVASIPAAIPPASIPAARSPVVDNRKSPPPGSSPPVASISVPNHRGDELKRQLPKPSKSIGVSTRGRAGFSRMLPSPSKSFGAPRALGGGSGRDGGPSRTRTPLSQSRSETHGLMAMRQSARDVGRSVTPPRRGRKKDKPKPPENMDDPNNMLGDLPPGVNMVTANDPLHAASNTPPPKKKKGKIFSRMFGGGGKKHKEQADPNNALPHGIPAAIPGPYTRPGGGGGGGGGGEAGPLPHSVSASRNINKSSLTRTSFNSGTPEQKQKQVAACSVCGGRTGKMLVAMDKKFHLECFRCMSCNQVIDPSSVFAVSVDPMGEQQPLHRKCYAEFYGVQCAVCKKAIPANDDGSVSFIKHPFFNTEQMCPRHADEPSRRRCTGCHRFEPEDQPFAELSDGDRCVCYACCRTVIMNNTDAKPLWEEVLRFFEFHLGLPIWEEMREIPILVVGQAALNENQLKDGTSVHGDSSQIMTRGLCLSEHDGSMSFRVPSQRFNDSTASFEACNHSGFLDFELGPLKGNTNSEVMAILCLSGLPRDLTASVLAHEATHAWIKLHPDFKVRRSLPVQVEEGCAQLVAFLFLSDGLEPPQRCSGMGPSDEKLRQYFKFSIETDDNDIYGEGYRKAALAYSTIGIAALLNHVVHYQQFPPL